MWWNICRHPYGDTAGTIDEKIRNLRWQYSWFLQAFIIVRHEINSFLVDIGKHFRCNLRHTYFGITHRSGTIAVDRAKVTVAVHQQVMGIEILRQTNRRVVNGAIPMWMILTEYVTDDTSGFLVRFIWRHACFVHRVQNTTMYWFQAIAHIWKRTHNDYGHCIIDVRVLHFFINLNGMNIPVGPLLVCHNLTSFY